MIDEALQAQATAYALGALEPAEARAFEERLAGDAELRAFVRELNEVSALLAAGASAATPSPELRQRVLDSVKGAHPRLAPPRVMPLPSRRRAGPVLAGWIAAAAALVLAVVQTVRLGRRDVQLHQVLAALDSTVQRGSVLESRLAAILDGNTRMYVMEATGANAGPRYGAQVFWRRDHQTWLVHGYNMPRPPAGKVYQLWYVTPTLKISAGVFEVDNEGRGVKLVSVPREAQGATLAAMTLEPAGGSAQPTGPIVIAGSVAEAAPARR